MANPAQFFAEGGIFTWVILTLDVIGALFVMMAFGLSLFARVKGKGVGVARALATLTLVGCTIPLCAGMGGSWWAGRQVDAAVAVASPDMQETLQEVGDAQAGISLKMGVCSSLCCVFPAFLALAILPRRKSAWEKVADTSTYQ